MEILKRQDLMQMDFKDFPITGREIGDELERKIKHIEFVYYGQRSDHLHEFFLPGEAKFFSLEKIDEKYDEYRKLAADEVKSEEASFRVDYGILGLLKKSKGAIKQLKILNPKNLENTLYEAGLKSIELALDPLKFEQEKLKKFLDYYGDILNNTDDFTKLSVPTANKSIIKYEEPPSHGPKSMPGKPPFFIYARSLLSEPIPAEEPTTLPEQEYLDQLIRQPDNGQKGKYTEAAKGLGELWQGTWGDYKTDQPKAIIPDEPDDVIGYLPNIKINDKKPVVKITNTPDLLKALGLNTSESLGGLESEAVYKPRNNHVETKEDAPVTQAKPLEIQIKELEKLRDSCDNNKHRENVPGGSIYVCKTPEKYKGCAYKGEPFSNPKWPPRCNLETIYTQLTQAKK